MAFKKIIRKKRRQRKLVKLKKGKGKISLRVVEK